MTALPVQPSALLSQSPEVQDAYSTCLQFEHSAQASGSPLSLISARILGYLILHAPLIEARSNIAESILYCRGDDIALDAMGNMYLDHFIRPFKMNGTHGSSSSCNAFTLPDFETCDEMIASTFVEAPKSCDEAKQNALIRDSFRCVISGKYDMHMVARNKEVKKELVGDSQRPGASGTSCFYIIPSTDNGEIVGAGSSEDSVPHVLAEASNRGTSGKEPHFLSSIWDVMEQFGYEQVRSDLHGNKVHSLENLLTLRVSAHILFNTLSIWLERTDAPHVYTLGAAHPTGYHGISEGRSTITLTSPDPKKYPLPSPTFLEIHAFCAKVAHFSGAGNYIEFVEKSCGYDD